MPPFITMHSEQTPYRERGLIDLEPQLPIVRAEDYPEQYRQRSKANLQDLMRLYDYAIQAPIRAGVSAYQKGLTGKSWSPELQGLRAMATQYFKKPETATSWADIAQDAGLSPMSLREAGQRAGSSSYFPDVSPAQIGGFLGENMVDPTNLMGAGMAMGGIKYADDVARGGKKLKKLFHGTAESFDDFDVNKTADGAIWFTDNKNMIEKGEVGASGKGHIIERLIDEGELKLGNWDDQDKYFDEELIRKGFDGLKLESEGETTYKIFDPKKLKKVSK